MPEARLPLVAVLHMSESRLHPVTALHLSKARLPLMVVLLMAVAWLLLVSVWPLTGAGLLLVLVWPILVAVLHLALVWAMPVVGLLMVFSLDTLLPGTSWLLLTHNGSSPNGILAGWFGGGIVYGAAALLHASCCLGQVTVNLS
jgi:hypothetical protein